MTALLDVLCEATRSPSRAFDIFRVKEGRAIKRLCTWLLELTLCEKCGTFFDNL